jgi:hypothetical protein
VDNRDAFPDGDEPAVVEETDLPPRLELHRLRGGIGEPPQPDAATARGEMSAVRADRHRIDRCPLALKRQHGNLREVTPSYLCPVRFTGARDLDFSATKLKIGPTGDV